LGLDPIKKLLILITGHKAKAHSKRKQKKTWLTYPISNFRVVSLYSPPPPSPLLRRWRGIRCSPVLHPENEGIWEQHSVTVGNGTGLTSFL
jgi:hypothetical protein